MNNKTNVYAYVQAQQNNEGTFITKQKLQQSQFSFNDQRILLYFKTDTEHKLSTVLTGLPYKLQFFNM